MNSTLLLLDGHSLADRAFAALPADNFTTADGQHTNAVYAFTSMLINLLREEQPTHIAAAFNITHQPPAAPEFTGQIDLINEILSALGIPAFSHCDSAAADILATLATDAERRGHQILIVSGNRDTLQLVTDNVTVLYPKRGVSEMTRFTPTHVETHYGLTPAQYPDFAALRGDPHRNLPGIPGVGEKTATTWIREYGTLANLIEHADQIGGRIGTTLRTHLPTVQTNRRLTELARDVPLTVDTAGLQLGDWDRDRIHQLLTGLDFRVLRDRLSATLTATPATAPTPAADDTRSILARGRAAAWLADHTTSGRTALHLAVDADHHLHGLALAAADATAAYIDLTDTSAADSTALATWLADPTRPKAVHDSKRTHHLLRQHQWHLSGVAGDTYLAAHLSLPSQRNLTLDDLARRYLRRELDTTEPDRSEQMSLLDIDDHATPRSEQHMNTARAVSDLAIALDAELDRTNSRRLLTDLEIPVAAVLADLETAGITVNTDHLDDLGQQLADQVRTTAHAAYAELGGQRINLGSPRQIQTILFDELGMPKTKKTRTGYSTDAEALHHLYLTTKHPFLQRLLAYRDATKMHSTVEGLTKSVAAQHRIHTTFNQAATATGRLSSTDPNLQNIPVRTATGRQIREAFIPGADFDCLMTADYSQIEMRIMAHLSNDAGLIEAFTAGEDLHNFVGSRAFNVPIDQVTPQQRRRVKAMSYGLAYGLSEHGLATQLGITRDEAKHQMDTYFDRFGGVRDYLANIVTQATRNGYTATLFGRRRYLPDLKSSDWSRRQAAERMALNAPIQGTAADIIKIAMINVHTRLHDEGLRSRILLQVHDELVLEIAPNERDTVEALVREEMSTAATLSVPLDVSIGTGSTWNAAAH